MARLHHPTVLFLFLGGTTLEEGGRRGVSVTQPRQVKSWLEQMSEVDIIGAADGLFVHNGLTTVGLNEWAEAAKLIKERYEQYDGFVMIHQMITIPPAAVALSLMLASIGKPVVFVGSPLLSPAERAAGVPIATLPEISRLGAKAHFINAVQVAVSDIGEVVAVVGHQVYRGRTLRGPWPTLHGQVIGKIDFGVRFFEPHDRRRIRPIRLKTNFEPRVAILEYLPGLDIRQVKQSIATARGVFLSSPPGLAIPVDVLVSLSRAVPAGIPIVLSGQPIDRLPPNVIPVSGDRTTLLVHFLWALGQTRQPRLLRRLLTA